MHKPKGGLDMEERIGKVVGQTPSRTPNEFVSHMVRQFEQLGRELPYPRGVYRFRTFEEADAWAEKHRISAAVKRLRGRQR